ncbi:MAG TPA: DNA polymerase IV [Terriglobia bacterium]|nr:DNA polymerase IV [Terriglobia bacterium]
MSQRVILHVDMDAFYASIEQRDNPVYKGRPVIIGADPKQGRGRGVVAACSYEARAFGVHSALPIGQAWKLCPDGVYLPPRMAHYVAISAEIMAVLERFTDLVEPLSIDEAFMDITGSIKLLGSPEHIAREVKRQVRETTGLAASAGAGPNKFIAKIASDIGKPDGLVIVAPENVEGFLADLPISRLWGVGPKTEKRLHALGFRTIGDIRAAGTGALKALGDSGAHLEQLSRGIDERPVAPHREPKSIGAETTFDEDSRDREFLTETIRRLAERVGRRLRQSNYRARQITLKLRYTGFETHTRQATAARPVRADMDIARMALGLFDRFPLDRKVRLLGVSASGLVLEDHEAQLDLFADRAQKKTEDLNDAVDRIRDKFGDSAIVRPRRS